MDNPQKQEKEEKNEGEYVAAQGEDAASEGEGTAEEEGRDASPDLPLGWRVKSNEHTLPAGWRARPANTSLSVADTPATGGSESVEDINEEGGGDKEGVKRSKRKSTRRSKTKTKTETVELKFIQTNCDGFTSKKESFDDIIKVENPDVIVINDTALKGNRKVKIQNHFSYTKNPAYGRH